MLNKLITIASLIITIKVYITYSFLSVPHVLVLQVYPPQPLCDDMNNLLFQLQFSGVDLDQALFQPFPSEITFQNYIPCEVYEVPLVLRNNDKVSVLPRGDKLFQDIWEEVK